MFRDDATIVGPLTTPNDGAFSFDLPYGTNIGVYGMATDGTCGTRRGGWRPIYLVSDGRALPGAVIHADDPAVARAVVPAVADTRAAGARGLTGADDRDGRHRRLVVGAAEPYLRGSRTPRRPRGRQRVRSSPRAVGRRRDGRDYLAEL